MDLHILFLLYVWRGIANRRVHSRSDGGRRRQRRVRERRGTLRGVFDRRGPSSRFLGCGVDRGGRRRLSEVFSFLRLSATLVTIEDRRPRRFRDFRR